MRARILLLAVALLVAVPSFGADPAQFRELYSAGDYAGLVDLCDSSREEILIHEYADRMLYYCGRARLEGYTTSNVATELSQAVEDLQRSLYLYYLPGTSFALGQARLNMLDQTSGREEKRMILWRGLGEMWDAIVKRHAEDGFPEEVLSDAILKWSLDYHEVLLERLIKEQSDPALIRWLTARVRMLSDRYQKVDPSKGENEVRQGNLEFITDWMLKLGKATYFDRNPVVGAYKHMGDRRESDYQQNEETQQEFHKSLYYYNEGLSRAHTLKAKTVLHERVAYLCTLYQSGDKTKKVEFYKQGFHHATAGIHLADRIMAKKLDKQYMAYRFEPETSDLVKSLQKYYGINLSGLIYFLWEREDFKAVVALRKNAYDTGFDWKTKADDLLRIADAAAKLAKQQVSDRVLYAKYKEMCLTSSSRAFKFTLKKFNGKMPTQDATFCTALSAYSSFLSGFGQTVESTNLDRSYGRICEGPPADGEGVQ